MQKLASWAAHGPGNNFWLFKEWCRHILHHTLEHKVDVSEVAKYKKKEVQCILHSDLTWSYLVLHLPYPTWGFWRLGLCHQPKHLSVMDQSKKYRNKSEPLLMWVSIAAKESMSHEKLEAVNAETCFFWQWWEVVVLEGSRSEERKN